jgi:sulfoquinovosyltransferase
LLRHLADGHDTVELVTVEVVDGDPPRRWLGFPVHYTRGVPLPHYPLMSISTDYTLKAFRVIARMRPDILHVTSPGFMIFGALFCSRIFQIPVVVSYHTHLPVFVRSYLRPRIVSRMAERLSECSKKELMCVKVGRFRDIPKCSFLCIARETQSGS